MELVRRLVILASASVPQILSTGAIDWIDSPGLLTDTVDRVRDVRALGLDVGVDFHGRLHKGMAKQLAKLLQPLQPMFIEEPLLPTQPEEIADLAQMVSTPIALGERLYTRHDFRPYLERRAIDIAQPDVRGRLVLCNMSHADNFCRSRIAVE